MKKRFLYFCLILVLFIGIEPVHAAGIIDPNQIGSIQVQNVFGDTKLKNRKISLYYIASIQEDGSFTYESSYQNHKDPKGLSTEELVLLAKNLQQTIEEEKIKEILKTGLYLIEAEKSVEKDYEYTSLPILITVPTYDEIDDEYLYQVNITSKIEAKKIEVKKEEPSSNPFTGDKVIFYIAIFGVSILALVLLVIINIKRKGSRIK